MGAPKAPKVPKPVLPPPPPKDIDLGALMAAAQLRVEAGKRGGRESTIVSSPQGIETNMGGPKRKKRNSLFTTLVNEMS